MKKITMSEKYILFEQLQDEIYFIKKCKVLYVKYLPLLVGIFAGVILICYLMKIINVESLKFYLNIYFLLVLFYVLGYIFLHFVLRSKLKWEIAFLSDREFLEYAGDRKAREMAKNTKIFIEEHEKGLRSSLSTRELEEIKESLEAIKEKRLKEYEKN